jgi:hypothetical protein
MYKHACKQHVYNAQRHCGHRAAKHVLLYHGSVCGVVVLPPAPTATEAAPAEAAPPAAVASVAATTIAAFPVYWIHVLFQLEHTVSELLSSV